MLLEFVDVSKKYNETNFHLSNISFSVDENEIVGIVGQNGIGKSTILKMANHLVKNDSGKILYDGKDISKFSDSEIREFRKSLPYIFQNANLLENRTVYYHLILPFSLERRKVDNAKIDELLKFFNIEKYKNSYVSRLSGGQKQKVAIIMAILQNPRLILCDEITSQLDFETEIDVANLLLESAKTNNTSILFVSHNLELLKNICDKVIIIGENGKLEVIKPKNKKSLVEIDYFENVRRVLND